ncbi:MAG: hypothetical protein KAS17_01790 [Victivallaceae bacterium]|nr:hypothetical protein [Victivallaceae bacterium]
MTRTCKKWMILLSLSVLSTALCNAADYSYNQGDIECPLGSEGVSYTLSVSLGNLGVPSGLSFDTRAGVTTGSPSRISISGSFSGTIAYGLTELPTSDITISMNGKLIGGSGSGHQLTWSASGNCIAPFFITCNKEVIWIDSSTTLTASKEANWYIGGAKKHTGTSFSIGASANWTPTAPGEYIVTAKEKDDESNTDSRTIKVVKCTSLSVNAATPASTTINYKLEPSTVACSGVFKVGTNDSSTKSVSGDFNFTFNQDLILVTSTPLSLKLSNSDLAEKTLSNSGEEDYKTKTGNSSLHTYCIEIGQGYRYHSWSATNYYDLHEYSLSSSGKLLELRPLGAGIQNPSTRTAVGYVGGIQGYSYGFTDTVNGTLYSLNSSVSSILPPFGFVRGHDFGAKTDKNITSAFQIIPSFPSPAGAVIVITLGGGSINLTLN